MIFSYTIYINTVYTNISYSMPPGRGITLTYTAEHIYIQISKKVSKFG